MTFRRKTLASRPLSIIALVSFVGLTGCAQVYDDTKGWGNDVEDWFRQEFIQELKNSIHSIGKEPAGTPTDGKPTEPALVQRPAAPAEATGNAPVMAAKSAPSPSGASAGTATAGQMTKPAVPATNGAAANAVASNAADLPNIPAQAASPGRPDPAQNSTQKNLYPQTAGKPPANAAGTKTAALPPKKPAKKPAQNPASGLALHLSSNKSKEAAQREWAELKSAFPDQLRDLNFRIVRTDLGKKGVFYRVLAGSYADKPAAKQICSQLRKKQQYCAVMPAPNSPAQAKAAAPKTRS